MTAMYDAIMKEFVHKGATAADDDQWEELRELLPFVPPPEYILTAIIAQRMSDNKYLPDRMMPPFEDDEQFLAFILRLATDTLRELMKSTPQGFEEDRKAQYLKVLKGKSAHEDVFLTCTAVSHSKDDSMDSIPPGYIRKFDSDAEFLEGMGKYAVQYLPKI